MSNKKITLKMARVGANLTQAQMAEELGVHVVTYHRWENNPEDISIKDAMRICRIVDRPLDDIIFTTEG